MPTRNMCPWSSFTIVSLFKETYTPQPVWLGSGREGSSTVEVQVEMLLLQQVIPC